ERPADAVRAYEAAVRIQTARFGESPTLASTLAGLGAAYGWGGDPARALPVLERAVAMARATLPAGDPQLIAVIGELASQENNAGHGERAVAVYGEAIAIGDRAGALDINRAVMI